MLACAAAMAVAACARHPMLPTTARAPADTRKETRASGDVRVTLRHGSATERRTREQLERLFAGYDLRPFRFTREIVIDDKAIPHSHPVLTLHTRHLRDDLLLLSTYIHEQSHWFVDQRRSALDRAVAALEGLAPGLPVGFPDGAKSRESSYEHLVVIALEQRGMRSLVGELAARQVMEFWTTDHYRALYRYVLDHEREVSRVVEAHGLWPTGSSR